MLGFFVAGMLLYKLRDRSIVDGRLALLALGGLIASVPLGSFILMFPVCGGYLVTYLALQSRLPAIPASRFGDLSYGLYIYGWPVEQTVLYLRPGTGPSMLFLIAFPIAAALAFLSWHLLEKWALRLKPRRTREPALQTQAL